MLSLNLPQKTATAAQVLADVHYKREAQVYNNGRADGHERRVNEEQAHTFRRNPRLVGELGTHPKGVALKKMFDTRNHKFFSFGECRVKSLILFSLPAVFSNLKKAKKV